MINLLPDDKKKELWRAYTKRRVAVILFSLALLLLLAAGTLLPLYLTLLIRQETIAATTATFVSREEKERARVRSEADALTAQLSALSGGGEEQKLADGIFPAILGKKGGVSLQGLTYERTPDRKKMIRLNGLSPRRDDLIRFLRALEESGLFSEVRSPVANLVKDRDLLFSIELLLK